MPVEPVTERLLLRTWRGTDRGPFAALNADPEVMRFFPAPMSRAESDALVDRIEERFAEQGFGLWAIEVRATGQFIGFTGLGPMPAGTPGEGELEVGYRLARSAWGNGYATEAGRAALRVAFADLGRSEVWSLTAEINAPSRAVMQRLGLAHVATHDHPALAPTSRLNPHVFYRIDRAAWDALDQLDQQAHDIRVTLPLIRAAAEHCDEHVTLSMINAVAAIGAALAVSLEVRFDLPSSDDLGDYQDAAREVIRELVAWQPATVSDYVASLTDERDRQLIRSMYPGAS